MPVFFLPLDKPIVEGATYTLNFNDEVYECRAEIIGMDLAIGNVALADAEATDTGEPFLCLCTRTEAAAYFITTADGPYKLGIEGLITTHKTIDKELIPAEDVVVLDLPSIGLSEDDFFCCNTVNEIIPNSWYNLIISAAIHNKPIVVICGETRHYMHNSLDNRSESLEHFTAYKLEPCFSTADSMYETKLFSCVSAASPGDICEVTIMIQGSSSIYAYKTNLSRLSINITAHMGNFDIRSYSFVQPGKSVRILTSKKLDSYEMAIIKRDGPLFFIFSGFAHGAIEAPVVKQYYQGDAHTFSTSFIARIADDKASTVVAKYDVHMVVLSDGSYDIYIKPEIIYPLD